ncbi:MAG: GTP-binding protein [Rhizobiaceae bacterium]|nr:GTP-binding protein [Rhizobiaceae bacterium]
MEPKTKIPVILLTGFLGSGKTTFLNRILKLDGFRNSLVIVNEFGSVPVDHVLVEESAETIYELSNGCLCCNMRGELVETLARMDLTRFDRIFIETTGIADPLPVFQSLAFNPDISRFLQPSLILSVFDLARGEALIKEHPEARHQLAVSDQVLLTKDDLGESSGDTPTALRKLNPTAKIGLARDVNSIEDFVAKPGEKHDLSAIGHPSRFRSAVMRTQKRLSVQDLIGMLHMITSQFGSQILRVKGFALIEESVEPVIVQVSGAIIHDLEKLSVSLDHRLEETELVVITNELDPGRVVSVFDGFCGNVGADRPDKEALLNNPLAIPGG